MVYWFLKACGLGLTVFSESLKCVPVQKLVVGILMRLDRFAKATSIDIHVVRVHMIKYGLLAVLPPERRK